MFRSLLSITLVMLVLSSGSALADPVSTAAPVKKAQGDDAVLAAIQDITAEVDRANNRLEKLEQGFTALASRVDAVEKRQAASLQKLDELGLQQKKRLEEVAVVKAAAAEAEKKLVCSEAESERMKGLIAQARQEAAQANAQAQQANQLAQNAIDRSKPKGPIGKLLYGGGQLAGRVFPRIGQLLPPIY